MRQFAYRVALIAILMLMPAAALAEVEWSIINRLNLDSVPQDVAVTLDGQTLYILTEKGDILVYRSDGVLIDKITLGDHADSLKIGQNGEQVFVISRRNKTVQAIQIDFIRTINTVGAPSKGPENAPVVLAVFSDFQ